MFRKFLLGFIAIYCLVAVYLISPLYTKDNNQYTFLEKLKTSGEITSQQTNTLNQTFTHVVTLHFLLYGLVIVACICAYIWLSIGLPKITLTEEEKSRLPLDY